MQEGSFGDQLRFVCQNRNDAIKSLVDQFMLVKPPPTAETCLKQLCEKVKQEIVNHARDTGCTRTTVILWTTVDGNCDTIVLLGYVRISTTFLLASWCEDILPNESGSKPIQTALRAAIKPIARDVHTQAKEALIKALSDGTQMTLVKSIDGCMYYELCW